MRTKRAVQFFSALLMALSLAVAGSVAAQATDSTPTTSTPGPITGGSDFTELDFISDETMAALEAEIEDASGAPATLGGGGQPSGGDAWGAGVAGGCHVVTGNLYKRSSGNTKPYGTIGGHPSITCGSPMNTIHLATSLYKKGALGWNRIAGPFTSWNNGLKTLTQTSPEYVCKKYTSKANFRMLTRAEVYYANGNYAFGAAYEDALLNCA